ncbi:TRAM domain-containing protein [Candidatus Poribacteria bacterium]|nr:TRAM domain-containing protein [Candidatus Poribacteria bacterium]
MQAWFVRSVCLLVGGAASLSLWALGPPIALIPLLISGAIVLGERYSSPADVGRWTAIVIGVLAGLAITALGSLVLSRILRGQELLVQTGTACFAALACAASVLGFHHASATFHATRSGDRLRIADSTARILDTSVIIDGRIAGICRTGFIVGEIIIPRFVLNELQYIADSSETLRRNRGRRGIQVLGDLQEDPELIVRIVDDEFPDIPDVDAKLVALAKRMDGTILTNDANLKSVAELQGVSALNVNALANAVKPEILQGEVLTVRIVREGKEPAQGIAYLDDGTMIVVDGGKHHMNSTLAVEVTSVLQTSAGRMVFARIRDDIPRYEKA